MFQKGTSSWQKILLSAVAVYGCCLVSYAKSPEFNKEAFLAEVEIDDLLMNRDHEDAVVEQKQEQAVSVSESVDKPNLKSNAEPFILDETKVLAEIKHLIAGHFEIKDDFRISFDNPWAGVTLETPDWELVITSFPAQGLRSRFFVNFELWSEGKRLADWQESVHCELWADAYVAQQPIERGAVMQEGMVAVQPVDTLNLYQSPIEIGTVLSDYVVINSIKQGEPISRRDLKERPLIEKNNIIDVVAQEGYMKVTLKGKALEDGVKGQFIRVRNLQSFSDIQAEVVGVNRARVYF